MILEKIVVEKFKRIKKASLRLADVTILVGSNGSGKSSIIQAVHLACCVMRQADRVEGYRTSTVGVDELDYLPTNNYKMLGHKSVWGNMTGTSSSKVELEFSQAGSPHVASCELRSARNAGISILGTVPGSLTDRLRKGQYFFSAYIPGISGIPNQEERRSRKVILKACSYGDSNIILRNALLLLNLEDVSNLTLIEGWIKKVLGPISIVVRHVENRDLVIACEATIGGDTRPLELIGTGYLQLIQIFAYVLLFKPGVLLIDEPDIHLHPSIQEKLVLVLAEVASERNLRVLITTHSPFVVRGAPCSAKVYWLKDGVVESENREAVELALGWGAFGKRMILVSEDTDTTLFKKLVSQWPDIERSVAFYPGTGFKHLPTPEQAASMSKSLGGMFKIMIHRDRDSLTDAEVSSIAQKYEAVGVHLWCPEVSDIEAYFCSAQFLSSYLACSLTDAAQYVETTLVKHATPIRQQFDKQRTAHNEELHKAGGSPTNSDVWQSFQGAFLRGAKGKFIFGQLKNEIPAGNFGKEKILASALTGEIGGDLKAALTSALAT